MRRMLTSSMQATLLRPTTIATLVGPVVVALALLSIAGYQAWLHHWITNAKQAIALIIIGMLLVSGVLVIALFRYLRRHVLQPLQTWEHDGESASAEHAKALAALQAQRSKLEADLTTRTQELATARIQTETATRSKSAYLAHMGHELRTPLNSIIGYTRMLLGEDGLTERQRRNLDVIQHAGTRLTDMLNDILALSKIDAGKIELKPELIDPTVLLNEVATLLRPRAEQQGLTLQVQTANLPALIWVDAPKLRQVLLNLLNNAIEYTPAGHVTLNAGARNEGDMTAISFHVSDTGIGIAPADQQRVFEPFVQLYTGVKNPGAGLGLAISQQFVTLLGGTLRMNSIPGQGTRISFTLTLATRSSRPAPTNEAPMAVTSPLSHYRIMIVDDTPEIRMLMRDLLEPLAMQIEEAGNGEDALAQILSHPPHVVLLDWRLPGMSGIELTRCIRQQQDLFPRPYIIMLTANVDAVHRAEANAAGVDDFMTKPVDIIRLKTLLLQYCQQVPATDATPPPKAPANASLKQAIAQLSEVNRLQMTTALRELNPAKLMECIDAIRNENAELADQLAVEVRALHYRALWQLFDISGKN